MSIPCRCCSCPSQDGSIATSNRSSSTCWRRTESSEASAILHPELGRELAQPAFTAVVCSADEVHHGIKETLEARTRGMAGKSSAARDLSPPAGREGVHGPSGGPSGRRRTRGPGQFPRVSSPPMRTPWTPHGVSSREQTDSASPERSNLSPRSGCRAARRYMPGRWKGL
jgi:hypothetical protein